MTRQFHPAVASLVSSILCYLLAMPYLAGGGDQEPPDQKVVYFDTDFEDGTLGPFVAAYCDQGCARPRVTNEAAHSGKRAVKMETTSSRGWHSRLEFRWCSGNRVGEKEGPCNPAASNPDGLYQRFWIMLPQATIDAVARGKQLKLLLNRYGVQTTRKHKGGWWQTGFGPEFGSPRDGVRTLEDSGLDPDTNVSTGVRLEGGKWYKVQTWYRRDPEKNKGRAVLWINGKKVADSGWLRGMGRDEATAQQSAWFGLVYASVGEPVVVYVDDVAAASHPLE